MSDDTKNPEQENSSESSQNQTDSAENAASVEGEHGSSDPSDHHASDAGSDHHDAGGESEFAHLQAEISGLKDQVLRARAETENVRRRADKDKADASAYAVTSFARDMLNVGDNLSRALAVLPEKFDDNLTAFVEGVEMTGRELQNIFERFGITQISPEAGEKFDPQHHQAMFEVPTEDHPAGSIVQIVGVGYKIKDRLLRPAMVGVAKNDMPKVDKEA